MRMVINFAALYDDVHCVHTFIYVLSMVVHRGKISKIIICLKIALLPLYGLFVPLGTIIWGTTQNVHTSDFKQFFIENCSQFCWFLCKACVLPLGRSPIGQQKKAVHTCTA